MIDIILSKDSRWVDEESFFIFRLKTLKMTVPLPESTTWHKYQNKETKVHGKELKS